MINTALLTGGVAGVTLLLFVEVLKELPLTLILRPFDFSTLATSTYRYASEEMLARAALPALVLMLTGLIPILLINRMAHRKENR